MCGICGISGFKDRDEALVRVQKMSLAIAHRGPDAEGIWAGNEVVLGHRRLSIIDTSAAGNQPQTSPDAQVTIVFNGEIYNHTELREELRSSWSFRTRSDTEVILAAYSTWGINCLHRFIGMFAIALWDETVQTLFLIRDRMGIKPLYYASTSEGFYFSSEIRSLLDSGAIERSLDEEGLMDYLHYQTVHAPRTLIRGVNMLLPGHYLALHKGTERVQSWWRPAEHVQSEASLLSTEEIKNRVADLLRSSVELRMRADVPFGAFLSGGIDSTAVVALMSQQATQKIKTFSITFQEKTFDESRWSMQVAKMYDTDHTEIRVKPEDFLEQVPEALMQMDHPSGDGPNTYVVSKVTRAKGVKMALSGLGGDELFAGYPVFRRMKDLENRKWLEMAPRFFRGLTGRALSALHPSVATEKLAEALRQKQIDFAHLYPLTRSLFSEKTVRQLLSTETMWNNPVVQAASYWSQTELPLLSKISGAEIETYLQNVLLRDTDQMSMAHALEVRVPFLDHRLVEFVLGIPDHVKYPHTQKKLLTDSLHGLIPPEIIHRPKMGFTFPWAIWMQNELRSYCGGLLTELGQSDHFRSGAVESMWQQFLKNDRRIPWSRIWPLVVLSSWMKQHGIR